jgi:hypothetical protein
MEHGTWDVALWPDDKWFKKEDLEPEHMMESVGKGDMRNIKVLDSEVRRNIDLEFLEKSRSLDGRREGRKPAILHLL